MRHIFVAVNPVNWEYPALVETWTHLGKVTHFQNETGFDQWDEKWNETGKPAYNEALLDSIHHAQKVQPISLFFGYLSGRWIYPETLRQIKALSIPLVNISFDDTIHFYGHRDAGGYSGNATIARWFDLCVTCQNPKDVWKYKLRGANAVFLPPGAPTDLIVTKATSVPDEIVCFLGQNYGVRATIVSQLAQKFPLRTFGKGWPSGSVERSQMGQIYRGALINLGFGFIGESTRKLGLKGRDFEVTAAGGFYLTSYHSALAKCFVEGEEIEFYRSAKELESKIRFYLTHPEKARAIGKAAQARVLKEHLWANRFDAICRRVLSSLLI
jgi:spore maturation protein CgeB